MKISIITPSFNQLGFLKETVASIQIQITETAVEQIVVDGGSTDGTVEYLRSLGDRMKWVSAPDHGQADVVNKGIRMASGDIIGWLNSDDLYLPGSL